MGSLPRDDDTGLTLYVILRDENHQVVIQATGAVEAYNSSNWGTYAHIVTEQGASGYYYATTSNSLAAGKYHITWKYQVGASPAVSDTVRASGSAYWSGMSWWAATVDVGTIKTIDADTAISARVDASTLAGKFAGITSVAKWLRGLFRKDAMDATAKNEVNDGGGTYNEATDSMEAQQEHAATIKAETALIVADTNELQTELADGGRIDLILDSIVIATSTLGTGARTVTITVTDGTDPLEGARVRMTNGAESYVGDTDADGEISFSLDDATWTVTVTKAMYSFTSTTLVVSDDTTHTYSMTATSITVSDPGFVTGYYYCYDEEGGVESGATVQTRIKTYSGYGEALDTAVRTTTSDASGLAEITNMLPGATYQIRRGAEGDWTDVAIPSTAISPYALLNVLGADS
jgi:hypothetical protein